MKAKIFTAFLLMLLIFYTNSTFAAEEHMDEHAAMDHCTDPTTEVTITGGAGELIVYDKKEYKVPKNTCVELIFFNLSTGEHDVSIDEVHDHMEKVHIHLANNTDGHEGMGMKSMHIQTPDEDTEFEIYCSVQGHEAAGMVAALIVGNGNPDDESFLPGFEFLGLFFAMTSLIIIHKRKNKSF